MTELTGGTLYEVRVTVADGGAFDLSEAEKDVSSPSCSEVNVKKSAGDAANFPGALNVFGLRMISAASR